MSDLLVLELARTIKKICDKLLAPKAHDLRYGNNQPVVTNQKVIRQIRDAAVEQEKHLAKEAKKK